MTDMTRSGALRTDRALLVTEDGTVFRGYGYGATGASLGEGVFDRHDRLQETLTDPSYAGQIVVQTASHGNTWRDTTDAESRKIWVAGYVVRDAARVASTGVLRTLDEELHHEHHRQFRALTLRPDPPSAFERFGAWCVLREYAERPEAELLEEVRPPSRCWWP